MHALNQLFRKNTGLSPYVWVVFYILPFYFIFHSTSSHQATLGITMIIAFFICYVLSFVSRGWFVYFWTSVQILISTAMGLLFGYIYFSLFLAFFIGNLRNRVAFFILYSIHIATTFGAINYGLVTKNSLIITQLPFVFLSLIAVILLPVSTYNRNKEDKLQGQLDDANKRIAELVKLEERQRIARDLHDTLGQKLSLIGLKSDLAGRLISQNPQQAQIEIDDVRTTARTALREVRELINGMRGLRLEDEVLHVRQILMAAGIEFHLQGDARMAGISLIAENAVCMCLKEAVTNVVKHSQADACYIQLEQSRTEFVMRVQDNGIGIENPSINMRGNGLRGMKERLEFINGNLTAASSNGTLVVVKVPIVNDESEVLA